ncbi:MAG: hypothetical protein IKL51_07970 [Lachnospiraceae bacterium]|nr:hypothetical protein [Lachnospiraceae bacterium]
MKKINWLFIGECIIILFLLLTIGYLIRMDDGMKAEEMMLVEVRENQQQYIEEELELEEENVLIEENQVVSGNSLDKEEINVIENTAEIVERNKKTQIVVLGDSIWNAGRGTDGISEQIMKEKDVIIYNCSIGGTTAAVHNESTHWENWTSKSFNGMMYLVTDIIKPENLIADDVAGEVFKGIDFEQVDYLIVSYGLNDYFSDVPIFPKEYYDLTSYVGALRHGIQKIREKYPQIKFILTSPTYCGWFENERQFGLGDYVEAARSVANEMDTYFIDMYHALGKNPQEKSEYLADGVHLTVEGREMYARSVIDFLNIQGIE